MSGRSGGQSRELARLATIERKPGEEEFRASVDEFTPDDGGEPKQYLSLRLWFRDQSGEFRPSKTGITVRRSEMREIYAALTRGGKILFGKESIPEPEPAPSRSERRAPQSQPRADAPATAEELDGLF